MLILLLAKEVGFVEDARLKEWKAQVGTPRVGSCGPCGGAAANPVN